MEDLTLNEIELKLFLLKKRTEKAIKKNEATMLRLSRANHERGAFFASLEGRPPPILEDDSLYNASLGSSSTTEYSDPEPRVEDSSSSDGSNGRLSSIDELRDDDNGTADSSGSDEGERHGVEQDSLSSRSYASSVTTTASSTASRVEAFLQLAASEERRILARLDRLRSRLNSEGDTVNARIGSRDQGSRRPNT